MIAIEISTFKMNKKSVDTLSKFRDFLLTEMIGIKFKPTIFWKNFSIVNYPNKMLNNFL